jgi:DNA-binding transcriptional LysR family regulator
MLQAGGAAYLPTKLVEPYIKNKQLFRVNDAPDMHRDVFASYHKDNIKTALMEEVVALFKQKGSQVAPSLIPE